MMAGEPRILRELDDDALNRARLLWEMAPSRPTRRPPVSSIDRHAADAAHFESDFALWAAELWALIRLECRPGKTIADVVPEWHDQILNEAQVQGYTVK